MCSNILKALKSSAQNQTFTQRVNPQTLFVLFCFNITLINLLLKQILANTVSHNVSVLICQLSYSFHLLSEMIINSVLKHERKHCILNFSLLYKMGCLIADIIDISYDTYILSDYAGMGSPVFRTESSSFIYLYINTLYSLSIILIL
jgi:hypothetical protein